MSLRDDVRWVREAADGLLTGWQPGRLPKWSTSEGEQLGWLVLLLWRKYYDASMARITLEAEVQRLKGDVDGLRETNERLTDLMDEPERETAVAVLAGGERPDGYYWVQQEPDSEVSVALWSTRSWWFAGDERDPETVYRVLRGPIRRPAATGVIAAADVP